MTESGTAHPPLEGVRVVDLAEPHGEVLGSVLWTLGADVLKVEPAEGGVSRRTGPLVTLPGTAAPVSAYWASVGAHKQHASFDVRSSSGSWRLHRLLDAADVLILSWTAAQAAAAGLAPDSLLAAHPRLIVVSVTPFGYDGPRADAATAELTVQASSGLVSLLGDPDRPPLPVPGPQSAYHAGAHGAGDVVAALCERNVTGVGQFLDVSMQAVLIRSLLGAASWPVSEGRDQPGAGDDRGSPRETLPGLPLPRVVACRDGYVLPAIVGTAATRGGTNSTLAELLRWRLESGEPGTHQDADPEHFADWETRYQRGELTREQVLGAVARAREFLATLTKRDLLERALERQLPMAPVLTVADLLTNGQLADREFWVTDAHGLHRPGPFARLSRTPLRSVADRAPAGGQPRRSARDGERPAQQAQRLADLRVADFTWAGVGPLATKWLADHGATVVHVESRRRLDTLRRAGAPWRGEPGPDRSQFFSNYNTSKLGLTLDLSDPRARGVAQRLVQWADVVVESYTPGVLGRLGVDLAEVRASRPEVITASTSLCGGTGRAARMRGYGSAGAALSGLHAITGWPDRPPCGPGIAYTDSIAPKFLFAALAAAVFERSTSGLGQHIDLSQVEASITFLDPEIIAHQCRAGGGRDAPNAAEAGDVFATAGTQRYLAVAATRAEHWLAVSELIGAHAGALDDARVRVELRNALAAWAARSDAFDAAEALLAAGVPASAVLRPSDLYHDPQLAHRRYYVDLDHPVMGTLTHDGCATRYSGASPTPRWPGPTLGQHNERVLSDLLGYQADEIKALADAGALT